MIYVSKSDGCYPVNILAWRDEMAERCERACDTSDPNYWPTGCYFCKYGHALLAKEYLGPIPPDEMRLLESLVIMVLRELVFEAVRGGNLHSSSKILNTLKDSGMFQEILKSEYKLASAKAETLREQVDVLGNVGKV